MQTRHSCPAAMQSGGPAARTVCAAMLRSASCCRLFAQPRKSSCPRLGRGLVKIMPATMTAGINPQCSSGCVAAGQQQQQRQSCSTARGNSQKRFHTSGLGSHTRYIIATVIKASPYAVAACPIVPCHTRPPDAAPCLRTPSNPQR